MSILSNHINELKAAEAFTKQAKIFDNIYGHDATIEYKRDRVRKHIMQYLQPESNFLELNCGTGEDALYFAKHGYCVHATDIAQGMLDVLQQKKKKIKECNNISLEQCSFSQLEYLNNKGPYDAIYSNFGGLNCRGELDKVLHSFYALLRPGGVVTLVIISKFCLWETLLLFKGKFRTAFRRFFSSRGRKAHIEGKFFTCWYYRPSAIINCLKNDFDLLDIEGLCTIVPPSYIAGFAGKYPTLFTYLCGKENKLKRKWPWKYTGDYFIISLKKKPVP